MGWDYTGPAAFDNAKALDAVQNANFANSYYVNISVRDKETKQAFTRHQVTEEAGGRKKTWEIVVVGHVHKNRETEKYDLPGNCYIPGWNNWHTLTPEAQCNIISALQAGGKWEDDRYPECISDAAV